mmetsp:Transcript_11788/g.18088  ORF Transcript_11788/g.18088 Transcript_11788/m.18088 type:complete len:102 (+) Transcript_11788:1808-2113(+)
MAGPSDFNRSQFDQLNRPTEFQDTQLGERMMDAVRNKSSSYKFVGPNESKEKLRGYFREKDTFAALLEKRDQAEQMNINLDAEIKSLNLWISEYDELIRLE